jgi:hypothetical protein
MGLFSRIAENMPPRLGIALAGIAGLWGFRTPPEPEVVSQMQPQVPSTGPAGPPHEEEAVHRPARIHPKRHSG